MKRFGSVIDVLPKKTGGTQSSSRKCLAMCAPRTTALNIRNHSIYPRTFDDDRQFLFSYFEYVGDDTAGIAADADTHRWWDACKPCLKPFDGLPPGECRTPREKVFHHN